MLRKTERTNGRLRRKRRIRKKVFGGSERPRLTVFRSNRHIYGQIIDDESGLTVAAASSLDEEVPAGDKKSQAKSVGLLLARRAREKGVETVVFDRNGYLYHGRVAAVAEGAREAGLEF